VGAIERADSTQVFHLCPALEEVAPRLAAARFEDLGVRSAFAAHLGDHELEGAPRGASSNLARRHREHLLSLLEDRSRAARVLRSVEAALPQEDLAEVCAELLAGPVDSATAEAIAAMDRRALPFVAEVDALLDRLDPREHHPYTAWAAASYLLAREAARERALATVVAFASVEQVRGYRGNPFVDRLAALLLEHAPDRALPHVRRALRSTVPAAVLDMAALLASIDQAWCHRELEAALREPLRSEHPSEMSCRRYLAAALARCGGDLARRRAAQLAPPPPVRAPGAIGFTADEVRAHGLEDQLSSALEKARPLAERLRARLPDDLE
jgi:hypothetical protein